MEDFSLNLSPFIVPVVAIIGWALFAIVQTLAKSRVRELEVRERIAMIERGLVPPPEVDPRGFDQAMNRVERLHTMRQLRQHGTGRHRRAGITLMGVGFGLMVMIGFAGEEPGVGVGVGGFLVIMGLAFFINGLFESYDQPPAAPTSFGAPPATPPPPGPIDPSRHE
jgi:hypothetical protein